MESELWILLFATHPDTAEQLLADQHQAKTQKDVQAIYRTLGSHDATVSTLGGVMHQP